MRIVVVRHGQAEPKKGWSGPDDGRPLVRRGLRQAVGLPRVIGRDRPARIISSPALRCRQTVQPLADGRGLEVEVSDRLSTVAGVAAADLVVELLKSEPAGSTVVLCTHREVLVEALPALSRRFGRKLGHRPPGAKGGAWVLRFRGDKLVKVDYRPPAG